MEVDMKKNLLSLIGLSVCAAALGAASLPGFAAEDPPAAAAFAKIRRASVSTSGAQANDHCYSPVLSPDGTMVAFISKATTLMPGGGGFRQVYVKTLATGRLKRVSTSSAGLAGDGNVDGTTPPAFSPDGTKVLFSSYATNLVPGDTLGHADIFEKNLTTGAIRRVSTASNGAEANNDSFQARYSPDGKKVVFSSFATNLAASDTNSQTDIFVKDLATGRVQRVSLTWDHHEGDGASSAAAFSPDGKKIVFASKATNLVAGDTNGARDIFVRDLATGAVARVDVDKTGVQANSESTERSVFHPDGKRVLFLSNATNLVAGDTNGAADVFAKSLATGAIKRVSTNAAGQQIAGGIRHFDLDGTGNVLAFAATVAPIDPALVGVARPEVVVDGSDVYVKRLDTGSVIRVSTNIAGVRGNGDSSSPSLSADGKLVAFSSVATNLVAGDTNGFSDVFVVTLK